MSDKPSLALLFDVRAESCRSCSNSFGASDKVWGQGWEGRIGEIMFTFQTSSFQFHVLTNLVCDGRVETLLLGHLLLNLCPR